MLENKKSPIKPLSFLKGAEDFDIAAFIEGHIYMLGGESVEATLHIERPQGIQILKTG